MRSPVTAEFRRFRCVIGPLLLLTAVVKTFAAPDAPTFNSHIAPLIYANCSNCHRDGEAAPFTLVTYHDVKKHAKQIVDITARHVMPPWKADADAHFLGERRLSPAQIEMIRQWVEQECPEGDPSRAPAPPRFTTGWQLGEPDMIVTMPQAYTLAAEGRDVYRCFPITVQVPTGKYLRAVEFRPGNRKIVHHAVLTTLPEAVARKRVEDEPAGHGPGFSSGLPAPGDRLAGPLGIWCRGRTRCRCRRGTPRNGPPGRS